MVADTRLLKIEQQDPDRVQKSITVKKSTWDKFQKIIAWQYGLEKGKQSEVIEALIEQFNNAHSNSAGNPVNPAI